MSAQEPQLTVARSQASDDLVAELRGHVDDVRERYSLDARLEVRSGDPSREIARLADDVQADAVIVGSSAKAGHQLVGSTAVKLVRAARWPVTVVP